MKIVFGYSAETRSAGVLELEPVGEDQVVALRRVGPERLVLLRRGPRLDVADREPERIPDLLESLVGAGIPGCVGDRPGRDESDSHAGSGFGGRGTAANDTMPTARSHVNVHSTVSIWLAARSPKCLFPHT